MVGPCRHSNGSRSPSTRWSIRSLFPLTPWVAIGIAVLQPITDNSFLWHVRAGDLQLGAGEVIRSDPFSFTVAGAPWRTQSWLIELMYGWLERSFELAFVPPWIAGCALLTIGAAGIRMYRLGFGSTRIAVGMIGLTWLGGVYFVPRPVVASFALLALLILVTEMPGMRWSIPLLLWVWAASHGSFVLGIGYVALYAIGHRNRRIIRPLVLASIVVSLTAHGWHVWAILWRFLSNRGALEFISEWAAPNPISLGAIPFFAGVIALIYQAIKGRIAVRDLWIISPFLLYGLTSQRALFSAMIVLVPWMVPSIESRERSNSSASPAVVLIGAGLIVALPFVAFRGPVEIDDQTFPVVALPYLAEGPAFHDDAVGGYLIYAGGPAARVFVDDRAELYGAEFFERVAKVRLGAPAWMGAQEEWDIQQALLKKTEGLVGALEAEGWIEVFSDDFFVVLRSDGPREPGPITP